MSASKLGMEDETGAISSSEKALSGSQASAGLRPYLSPRELQKELESIPPLKLSTWMHFLRLHPEEILVLERTRPYYSQILDMLAHWKDCGYPDPEEWRGHKWDSFLAIVKEDLDEGNKPMEF